MSRSSIKQVKGQGKKRLKWLTPKALIFFFLAGIMITSIFGFIMNSADPGTSNSFSYKNHTFKINEQTVSTEINGNVVHFYTFPSSVEHISVSRDIEKLLQSVKVLGITYDPYTNLTASVGLIQYQAESDIPSIKPGTIVLRGLTNTSGYQLDELSCSDASVSQPILLLREGNEQKIFNEGYCIIVESHSDQGMVDNYNRILYSIAGII